MAESSACVSFASSAALVTGIDVVTRTTYAASSAFMPFKTPAAPIRLQRAADGRPKLRHKCREPAFGWQKDADTKASLQPVPPTGERCRYAIWLGTFVASISHFRRNNRARCTPVFTLGTLMLKASAISRYDRPSTSGCRARGLPGWRYSTFLQVSRTLGCTPRGGDAG